MSIFGGMVSEFEERTTYIAQQALEERQSKIENSPCVIGR